MVGMIIVGVVVGFTLELLISFAYVMIQTYRKGLDWLEGTYTEILELGHDVDSWLKSKKG